MEASTTQCGFARSGNVQGSKPQSSSKELCGLGFMSDPYIFSVPGECSPQSSVLKALFGAAYGLSCRGFVGAFWGFLLLMSHTRRNPVTAHTRCEAAFPPFFALRIGEFGA